MATRTPTVQGRNLFHRDWGNYLSPEFLPNVAGSPFTSDKLEEGDTAYVDRALARFVCVDPTVGSAVWIQGGGAAGAIRSYGSGTAALIAFTPVPATDSNIRESILRRGGNMDFWETFDSNYSRSYVRLRFYSTGGSLVLDTTQVFANRAAITAFINANIASIGGFADQHVEIEVFDVEDAAIVPPPKIYGKNRFFAGLVSRSKQFEGGMYYGYRTGSAFYANLSSTASIAARSLILNQMWSILYPGFPMPAPVTWGPNEFGCFWVPRNRLRRYDMPAFNSSALRIDPGAGINRFVRNGGLTIPRPPVTHVFNGTAGDQVAYGSLDASGTGGFAFNSYDAFRTIAPQLANGASVIVGYPLYNGVTGQNLAVLVKPIGVDTFYVDVFDDSRYRIEAVGVQRENYRTRLRVLPSPAQYPLQRLAGPILVPDFSDSFGLTPSRPLIGGQPGRHGYTTGSVRFQYRDLLTNRVSCLTQARIETISRRRARPWALLVRNDQAA